MSRITHQHLQSINSSEKEKNITIAPSYKHPVFAIKNIGEKYVVSSWCFLIETQDDFKLNMKNYIQFNLRKQMYFLDEVAVLPASGIYVFTCVYNTFFI